MFPNTPGQPPNKGQYRTPATPPQWQGMAPTQQIPMTENDDPWDKMYRPPVPLMPTPARAPIPTNLNNPDGYTIRDHQFPPIPSYGHEQNVSGRYPWDANYRAVPVKKKHRVFLWVFLGVQVLFLIWLITGLARTSNTGATAHQQAVQWCSSKANWQYLFKSSADCVTHYGNGLNDAASVGKSIGVGIVIGLWVVVDFFLGLGYGIYKLTQRR